MSFLIPKCSIAVQSIVMSNVCSYQKPWHPLYLIDTSPYTLVYLRSQSTFCSLLFKFLNFVILKTFNEIVLAFLSVKSKTNIPYVNTNYWKITFMIR